METNRIEIPIENITITGLNNRTVFDEAKLNELAESIKSHGIIQNLTVRKNGKPGSYELVIGERRLRAAKIAGLQSVPCVIKELNDTEFQEVMLIENVQREDVHALDESETFLKLTKSMSESEVAIKVGKPTKYVKERLALNDLTAEAKKLFKAGTMQLGHALILCLFKKEHQTKAIQEVIQQEKGFNYFNHPQELKEFMNNRILCTLSDAIFDVNDPELVPKAGACTSCPKQSGANAELFACVTPEAKCMDQKCFIHKTEVFVSLQNKALLKQFDLKKSDCPVVSTSSYAYNGELPSTKWKPVKKADECQTVRVGFIQHHREPMRAIMICTDKSCKTHFRQEQKESVTAIPENEKPSETLARRLENRHEKERIQDYHTARKNFMEKAAAVKLTTHNEFELSYLITIMAGRGHARALEIARTMGFTKETDSSYVFDWIEDFLTSLEKHGKASMVSYLRHLILAENLSPEDKGIADREFDDDKLLLHGKSLGIEFKPFLKDVFDARKEQHLEEKLKVKELSKKERERDKAIEKLFANAEQDYPLLYQVIKAKDKVSFLQQQTLEDLSKLAYRTGMKRKTDATVEYYSTEISAHIKAKLKELK